MIINSKIRSKFILVSIITFLIFIILTMFLWGISIEKYTKKVAADNIYAITNASNNYFDGYLKDIYNMMTLISIDSGNDVNNNIISLLDNDDLSDVELVKYRKTAQDYLISLCSFKEHLSGLTVSNFSEHIVSYGVYLPYSELEKLPWYYQIKSMDKDSLLFIEPHTSNSRDISGNSDVISIVRPVVSSNKVVGFVMADIDITIFEAFFIISPNTDLSLTIHNDLSGKIITHIGEELYLQNSSDFNQYLTSKNIFHVSSTSDFTGWTTVGSMPSDILTSELISVFKQLIFFTLLIFLVFTITIYGSTSILTKDVENLTNAVKSVTQDNLDINIDVHSNDEIEELYIQFKKMLDRINKQIIEIQETENQKRIFEIRAMQAQINPHFLHNVLNTINFLAKLQGIKNISQISENISFILKINMDIHTMITIKEEQEYLEKYVEIQSYRYTNNFQCNIICDPNIHDYYIPKLIIQPLLENSIVHGIADQSDGIISIKIYEIDNSIHISISDNGCGMTQDKIDSIIHTEPSGNHIGLYNVYNRIPLYFGKEYALTIDSQSDIYTTIEFKIPKIEEKDLMNYV